MIKRCFVGREHPLLPEAVRLLFDRHAKDGIWDMSGVIVALPGAQAARRLSRLLQDQAKPTQIALEGPEILTPATLLEKLYTPAQKIAGPLQSYFAWIQAAAGMPEDERKTLAPKADNTDRPMTWAGVAREAQRARAAAAAEGLTLSEISQKCGALPGVCDDRRWPALANLERSYLAKLAEVGLTDRDDARMEALKSKGVSCQNDIYLIGAQDLNGIERDMLYVVASSVTAVIPAPLEEQDKFDDVGGLIIDRWHDTLITISDNALRFVDGPAEEAAGIVEDIAALGGQFAPEEITIGIGDEAAAESLARRLAVLGLPSFSPFGRPLSRVRPAALLGVVRDYLHAPTARTFAALARHPDLEAWLTARRDEAQELTGGEPNHTMEEDADVAAKKALPLLTHLDTYRSECLTTGLPTGPDDDPSVEKIAHDCVAVAAEHVQILVTELKGDLEKPISEWAEPIMTLLLKVYQDTQITDDAEGRQFERGLIGLQTILQGLKDLPSTLSPSVSGAEALAFVVSQAEAERLPSEPASSGGLEMMGWLELALDDAPVLLLTGLQEGCVPASTGDDSLLPDSLRQKLGLADDRHRAARDGFLLRQMIETRSTDGRYVHLIVPRRGADGDPRMPSRLLFACAPEEAARRAARFTDRAQDAPAALPLFAGGTTRNLTPPLPVKPEPPLSEMTVSAFADYLACPYRFYLRHVLKLKEQDDSMDEMDPRRFGNLLHDCLAGFAKSDAAQSVDVGVIQGDLQCRLVARSRRRFGDQPSRVVQMQIRQAGRRLEAFAAWQAQSASEGWTIQSDLSEKELTAFIVVDGEDFMIRGRLDRVDYHAASNQYRIIDYKTGDAGKGPEEKHRFKDKDEWQWTDLQLPLYRLLLAANNVDVAQIAPDSMGYVLLSSDLAPVTYTNRGKRKGGTGFVRAGAYENGPVGGPPIVWASWEQADHDSARQCAEEVIRNVRAGFFWPPTDPPPFPPSRTDPGRADVYSGLCFDSCSDRREWFGLTKENTR